MIVKAAKPPRPKKCRVTTCRASFVPTQSFQTWCSPDCAVTILRQRQEKQRKSFAQRERREIKARKEKLKSRAEHLKDTQQVFNAWVRARDALLPCVSCGRHHEGQWHAGHYRTVSAHPAIRFEPLNVWLTALLDRCSEKTRDWFVSEYGTVECVPKARHDILTAQLNKAIKAAENVHANRD